MNAINTNATCWSWYCRSSTTFCIPECKSDTRTTTKKRSKRLNADFKWQKRQQRQQWLSQQQIKVTRNRKKSHKIKLHNKYCTTMHKADLNFLTKQIKSQDLLQVKQVSTDVTTYIKRSRSFMWMMWMFSAHTSRHTTFPQKSHRFHQNKLPFLLNTFEKD